MPSGATPRAYRAELDARYRDSHPTMKALLAMMDLERRWPIGRPRSGPALEPGPRRRCSATPRIRRCNRWRRAPAWRSRTRVCLAELIDASDGDFAAAFRALRSAPAICAPRGCSSNPATIWDNFYHVDGIEREVARATCPAADEDEMFDCLAWLYDGVPRCLTARSIRSEANHGRPGA